MATTPSYRPGTSSGSGPRTAQTKVEARLADAFNQSYLYMVPGYFYHNDHFYGQTSGLGAGGARGPILNATLRQGSIVLLRMNSWSKDAVALIARRDTESAVFEPRLSKNPDRGPPLVPKTLYSDWTLLSDPFNLDGSQILQACGSFMDMTQGVLPASNKLHVIPPPSTGNTPRSQTPVSYKSGEIAHPYSSALPWNERSHVSLNLNLDHPTQLASALEKVSSDPQRSLSRDSARPIDQRSSLQSRNNSQHTSRTASNAPSNRGSMLIQSATNSGNNTPGIPTVDSAGDATRSRTSSVAPAGTSGSELRGMPRASLGMSEGHRSASLSRQESIGDLAGQSSATGRSSPAVPSSRPSRNGSQEGRNSLNGARSQGSIPGDRAASDRGSLIFDAQHQQTMHMLPPSGQTSATSTRRSSPSGAPAAADQHALSRPVSSAGPQIVDRVGRFERGGRASHLSPSSSVDSRILAPRQSRPNIGQQVRAHLDMTRGWDRSNYTGSGPSTRARSSPSRGLGRLQGGRQLASPSPLAASSIAATATIFASNATQYVKTLAQSQGVATAKTALNTGLQKVAGYFTNRRRGH